MRHYSLLDQVIINIDQAVHTLLLQRHQSNRSSPGNAHPESSLTSSEKQHVAGLMRINHAGEVCAQALYQGQALTANLTHVREKMQQAAAEEIDHLAWCEQRLTELANRPSYLNLGWYFGSLMIGMAAGLAGDQWSLGFVAETERQVVRHLTKHLEKLPPHDKRTQAILEQMRQDELQHATTALENGGVELPFVIKKIMASMSKIMTKTAYWI